MSIQWNRVTWYSKVIALALFVALPIAAFWWGAWYGNLNAKVDVILESGMATTTAAQAEASNYYADVAAWATDQRDDAGFSIQYPIDFDMDDNYSTVPSGDWRLDAGGTSGIKFLSLMIPRAFEPQTNFADATLTVGASGNPAAVAQCLTPDPTGGPLVAPTSTETINGTIFTVFHFNGVGAGNFYDTTSYRTLHAGKCYAIEYTIHSGQIANYPASYDLQPFDEAMITGALDRIAGTFNFQ